MPANASVAQTYADRGPGCTTTNATTLDCNLAYLSGDAPVANVILWLKLNAAGAMPVSATATYLIPDPKPLDNTGSFTVNQTPVAPPPPVVPPTVFCLVPKVSGLTLGQALAKLRIAHCGTSTVKLHLKYVKGGKVGLQLPKPGTSSHRTPKVKLTVSLGPVKSKKHRRRPKGEGKGEGASLVETSRSPGRLSGVRGCVPRMFEGRRRAWWPQTTPEPPTGARLRNQAGSHGSGRAAPRRRHGRDPGRLGGRRVIVVSDLRRPRVVKEQLGGRPRTRA